MKAIIRLTLLLLLAACQPQHVQQKIADDSNPSGYWQVSQTIEQLHPDPFMTSPVVHFRECLLLASDLSSQKQYGLHCDVQEMHQKGNTYLWKKQCYRDNTVVVTYSAETTFDGDHMSGFLDTITPEHTTRNIFTGQRISKQCPGQAPKPDHS